MSKLAASKVATGAFWYSIVGLLTSGANIILLPFFTEWMEPEEYGLLSIVQVLQRVALAVVSAGLSAAVIRHFHLYKGDSERFRKFFSSSFWFQSLLALCVAVALVIIPSYGWFGSGVLTPALILPLLLIVIFHPPRELVNQLYTAAENHRRASSNRLMGFAIATAASLILVGYFNLGAVGRVWGLAIGSISLALFLMSQSDFQKTLKFRVDRVELKNALAFGLPFAPYAFCVAAFGTIDRWVVLDELGSAEVGIYSSYRVVAFGVSFIYAAINQSWFPRFFQLKENGDHHGALKGQWMITCLLPLLASGFIAMYPVVMPILVNKRYLLESDPMMPLALSVLLMGILATQTCSLQYLRKTSWLVLIGVAGIVGCYLGVKALVPQYGLSGAAGGLVIGYATMLLVQMIVCVWVDRGVLERVMFPLISIVLGTSVILILTAYCQTESFLIRVFLSVAICLFYLIIWFAGQKILFRKSQGSQT